LDIDVYSVERVSNPGESPMKFDDSFARVVVRGDRYSRQFDFD